MNVKSIIDWNDKRSPGNCVALVHRDGSVASSFTRLRGSIDHGDVSAHQGDRNHDRYTPLANYLSERLGRKVNW